MIRRLGGYGLLAVALLLTSLVLTLRIGSVNLPAGQIAGILLHELPGIGSAVAQTWDEASAQIVLRVRLPRIVLSMLVGAALALAGAAFQGVLRNPLADPFTLGVSSGSSIGAALLIFFGLRTAWIGQWTLPLTAFVTGAATLFAVLALARDRGRLPVHGLLLAGVVMQSFLGAAVTFLSALSDRPVNEILFWTMGSLNLRGWSYSALLLPYVLIGGLFLWANAGAMNLFALGERRAAQLGLNTERTKTSVLLAATLVAAAAVSVSGVIGFVGLVVPHMIRLIAGPDYRLLVPLSALGGALFLMWADTLARSLLGGSEIPLGVVTAFAGAPFFALLLQRGKRGKGGIG
ncbi:MULTISPECIES: FecCD family ABC transporter permease [Saccharibacillus]|uniref:Iron chelate uptake ABC transporter family permease subunit n=1 Tax=Saccharibacillus brassicae TaxID=2583377 RepID=A0A4Y6V2G0_SACBS|nr:MULTISPECIES: iron chelate uptake ABC transporter family permease subunit [Saccharibacillus]MWJ31081.1 iron chelate uptake ABC transporter family permease subunit [Saccharibacillus sp. WB 17]QDH22435.1 iron chelate uptake ABC transporter family permease subunit [Saccharibacillus brassicae]